MPFHQVSSPMEQGMQMPASQGHRKLGMLGFTLTMVGVIAVFFSQSNANRKSGAILVANMTTQLAAGDCSGADRSKIRPIGFVHMFTSCASYSFFWGWDSAGTAQCIADKIRITRACALCFADAAGYAFDNCKSGDCASDQCGESCANCLAPAKRTAELCVGGEVVPTIYTHAMHQSCRPGISGMVNAGRTCAAETGLSCSSSDDCPDWSGSQCVGGTCQCNPPHTCSVNDGECVAPGNCPKFTGGTCAFLGCNAVRNAQCIGGWGSGKCMCSADECVHNGACVPASAV